MQQAMKMICAFKSLLNDCRVEQNFQDFMFYADVATVCVTALSDICSSSISVLVTKLHTCF